MSRINLAKIKVGIFLSLVLLSNILYGCGSGASQPNPLTLTTYAANSNGYVFNQSNVLSSQIETNKINALAFSPKVLWDVNQRNVLFAATSGGTVWANNSATTWYQLSANSVKGSLDNTVVNAITSNISGLFAGTQAGNVWAYGGRGWIQLNGLGTSGTLDGTAILSLNISNYENNTEGFSPADLFAGTQAGNVWVRSNTKKIWYQLMNTTTSGTIDGSAVNSIVNVSNNIIYCATALGNVWAYNNKLWGKLPGISNNGSLDNTAVMALTQNANTLYAATSAGNVWSYNNSKWSKITGLSLDGSLDMSIVSSLTINNNTLYAGTIAGNIWTLDLNSNNALWVKNTGFSQYNQPVLALVTTYY